MKKLLIVLLISVFLVTGCGNSMTPTGAVEDFLGKYQSMDSEVLAQLDSVVSNDTTMSDEQKKEYKSLMEKQYQYLSYKITNEEIVGDTATVDVEIEVFDYATSIRKSTEYYNENRDMFYEDKNERNINSVTEGDTKNRESQNNDDVTAIDEDSNNKVDNNASHEGNVNTDDGTIIEETSRYIDYKIEQLKNVTDKVKYTITFNLSKEDDKWVVDDISDIDRKKIHGLFDE